jgi:hypothetical protein
MRWTQVVLLTRAPTCGRRNRVVLTPRRRRQVCRVLQATVTRKPDHRGEREYKPLKPLRAGMLGDPGATVVTTLACSLHILHARLRVHWAPGIPHALSWAEDSCTARTLRAAGSRTRIQLLLPATGAICRPIVARPCYLLLHRRVIDSRGAIRRAGAFSSESLPRT